eukprot:632820_1
MERETRRGCPQMHYRQTIQKNMRVIFDEQTKLLDPTKDPSFVPKPYGPYPPSPFIDEVKSRCNPVPFLWEDSKKEEHFKVSEGKRMATERLQVLKEQAKNAIKSKSGKELEEELIHAAENFKGGLDPRKPKPSNIEPGYYARLRAEKAQQQKPEV